MTSQKKKKKIVTHILPNILRIKGNFFSKKKVFEKALHNVKTSGFNILVDLHLDTQ